MEIALSSGAFPYLEYGWVTAPNAAGQSISANTITTLTIDTEIADTGNNGSITSNQVTLAAGTYRYFASCPTKLFASNPGGSLGFYNVTDSSYVNRGQTPIATTATGTTCFTVDGQITISSSKTFDLRLWTVDATTVTNSNTASSISTAGADQRTTIKLWKVA